jgi:hypothetical protein
MKRAKPIAAPWPFARRIDPSELGVTQGVTLNEPTPEGEALGSHLARFVEVELQTRAAELPGRCHDCAFRRGSKPNGCPSTLMDALKCVLEGETFYCHINEGKPCAGWVALSTAPAPEQDKGDAMQAAELCLRCEQSYPDCGCTGGPFFDWRQP